MINKTIDGYIIFKVNDSGSTTEVMRLDGSTSELVLEQQVQMKSDILDNTNPQLRLTHTDGSKVLTVAGHK